MDKFNPEKVKNLNKLNHILKVFFHTKKSKEVIVWGTTKSILVVDFTNIGDLIMLIPLLKILRNNAPGAKLFLCCNMFGQDVLDEQGLVDGFYLLDGLHSLNTPKNMLKDRKMLRKKVQEINQKKFDVILEPRGDLRYIFFMHFLNGKRKVSYNYTGGEEFLTDVVLPDPKVKHLIEDKMVFLEKIGCTFKEKEQFPKLQLTGEGKAYNQAFMRKYNITRDKWVIGIHPGASWENKRWKYYPELIKKIFMSYPESIFLVFSAKGEEKYADDVCRAARMIGADYVLVSENLRNYIRIMSICNIVVCNDSGAAHIAAAYGCYVTVIYGPFFPELCQPLGENVKVISHMLECKPCMEPDCKKGRAKCIDAIRINEVWSAVMEQLGKVDKR